MLLWFFYHFECRDFRNSTNLSCRTILQFLDFWNKFRESPSTHSAPSSFQKKKHVINLYKIEKDSNRILKRNFQVQLVNDVLFNCMKNREFKMPLKINSGITDFKLKCRTVALIAKLLFTLFVDLCTKISFQLIGSV